VLGDAWFGDDVYDLTSATAADAARSELVGFWADDERRIVLDDRQFDSKFVYVYGGYLSCHGVDVGIQPSIGICKKYSRHKGDQ